MMLLQLGWLGAIWAAGAANNQEKLLPLVVYTIFTGVLAVYVEGPAFARRFESWKLAERLAWNGRFWMLALTVVLLVIGVYYTANQRMWDFDEEGNYAAAELVAANGPAALFSDYQENGWLGKQHPPLGPLMYGAVLFVFGAELHIARWLSLAFAIGIAWLTFLIGRLLYDGRTGLLAAWFLFSFPLYFRLGTAAVVETPLVFLFALTIYLTLKQIENPRAWRAAAVGLVIAAGLVLKYTMVFVLPVVAGLFLLKTEPRRALGYLLLLLGTGGLFLAVWLVYAAQSEIFQRQVATIWNYATMVTTNPYGRKLLFETLTTRLPTAFGVYNLPILALSTVVLLLQRQKQNWPVFLWIGLVWLPLLLTLPEHRYFLVTFPAVAILAGRGVQQLLLSGPKLLILSVAYSLGSLYLFVDWFRVSWLFIK